jgi:hypothetical protein
MAKNPKNAGRKPGPTWTPGLRLFWDYLKSGTPQGEAARRAYPNNKNPNIKAATLMKNPLIVAAREEQEKFRVAAEQKAAEKDAMKPVITRRRIEELLVKEAEGAENDGARVRALIALAEIKGMKINRNLDLGDLAQLTEEEQDYFAKYGYLPDQKTPERVVESGRSSSGVCASTGSQASQPPSPIKGN